MPSTPEELDDTTAAEVGRAVIRFMVNEDPAGVTRFFRKLDAGALDDAKAARIGHAVVELFEHLPVA